MHADDWSALDGQAQQLNPWRASDWRTLRDLLRREGWSWAQARPVLERVIAESVR